MAAIQKTPFEMQQHLGNEFRKLRLSRNLTRQSVADKAHVSVRAVGNFEAGHGSTVETMCRILKALDAGDVFDQLAPRATVDPMVMLSRHQHEPRRASSPRRNTKDDET